MESGVRSWELVGEMERVLKYLKDTAAFKLSLIYGEMFLEYPIAPLPLNFLESGYWSASEQKNTAH